MATEIFTEEAVEEEIERLRVSPYVALARKAERVRNFRRQYLYTLRSYEKKGKQLEELGVTMDALDDLAREVKDSYS